MYALTHSTPKRYDFTENLMERKHLRDHQSNKKIKGKVKI